MKPSRCALLILGVSGLFFGCGSPAVEAALPKAEAARTELPPGPTKDVALVARQPVAKVRTPPRYPAALRDRGIVGEVTVDFVVGTDGATYNVRPIRATHEGLGAAAVAAIQKWKFTPAEDGGRRVNCHMQVPIVFSLND